MSNYEVLQTMTVKELANLLNDINSPRWGFFDERDWEDWLRADSHSQADCGLLTDEQKKYWKVH